MEVYRGDIFFIQKYGEVAGSEQEAGRPAVIVSNNTGNHYSNILEVVYLITKHKKPMPTHVEIMCQVPSTALCEQISNVSKERLGEYIRSCTDEEMQRIDEALMISLGIDLLQKHEPEKTVVRGVKTEAYEELKMKLEEYESMLDKKNEMLNEAQKQITDAHEYIEQLLADKANLEDDVFCEKSMIRMETEIDLYKQLYEQMLEKMCG